MTSREFRDRVTKRARRADLAIAPGILDSLEAYYRLLARWNEKINLTALPLREPTDEAVDRLIIEPLAAARFVPDSPLTWFDVGSGGGSPALPLKLVRPSTHLTMVESKTRKAAFLREAVRTLGVDRVDVRNARFEAIAERTELRQTVGLVTVRAVKADKVLVKSAAALLSPGGCLLLFSPEVTFRTRPPHPFSHVHTCKLGPGQSSTLVVLRRDGSGTTPENDVPRETIE